MLVIVFVSTAWEYFPHSWLIDSRIPPLTAIFLVSCCAPTFGFKLKPELLLVRTSQGLAERLLELVRTLLCEQAVVSNTRSSKHVNMCLDITNIHTELT